MSKQQCKECNSEDFNVIDGRVVCKWCGEVVGTFNHVWSAENPINPLDDLGTIAGMINQPFSGGWFVNGESSEHHYKMSELSTLDQKSPSNKTEA